MDSLKTSYILNKYEILLLFNSIPDIEPSGPARFIIDRYLSDNVMSLDAVEGLVYKKLAKKLPGGIVIEPVVDYLMRSALSSDLLWIVGCADADDPDLVLKTGEMYLHIRKYPHISDSWRITPYQSKELMLGEFDGQTILEVNQIDKNGTKTDEPDLRLGNI